MQMTQEIFETFQHRLEKFDPGVVWLDRSNRVTALNSIASHILGVKVGQVIGTEVTQLHPEKSRRKVAFLLESSGCPAHSPPPMTMMINVPDRVLLIKVVKMWGSDEELGTCMVFYDLTDITTSPHQDSVDPGRLRQLFKLPVYKNSRVILLDLNEVVHFKADGHYTTVFTESHSYLCNLALTDLELRLDPAKFVRVHRSHMVNVLFAAAFDKVDEQYTIVMRSQVEANVPVSRSNVPRLKLMFGLN